MSLAQNTEVRDMVIALDAAGIDRRSRRSVISARGYNTIGKAAFYTLCDRDNELLHDLDGWPECECCGCGCSDPATCTDDGGVPVCAACSEYAVDDDGEVHCSNGDDVETINDSWGRPITRIKPPSEPETDPEGEWACYWDTCGDDRHVVARYTTQEQAEQAGAAKDWPGPGDSTAYLCGYEVRELVDGRWIVPGSAD